MGRKKPNTGRHKKILVYRLKNVERESKQRVVKKEKRHIVCYQRYDQNVCKRTGHCTSPEEGKELMRDKKPQGDKPSQEGGKGI